MRIVCIVKLALLKEINMANLIKYAFSVQYTEEELQKTTRFLDDMTVHEPVSYSTGETTLPGNTMQDFELASNVNMIILKANKPITIQIGDTTANPLLTTTAFAYDGATTKFFVLNPNPDPVIIKVSTAKY